MRLIDITGQRFGRAVVIDKGPPSRSGGSIWNCVCGCGTAFQALGGNLRAGCTKSCGCLAHEHAVALGSNPAYSEAKAAANLRHGHKRRTGKSPEYRTWLQMKRRCYDPKCKDFANWGGRGIKVCDRWRDSFEAFLADMGQRPAGLTIDRLDPNGHYGPGNCRWATEVEQASENRRDLIPVTVGDRKFGTLTEACRHYGVKLTTAHQRIAAGIDPAEAVSTVSRLPARRSRESYLAKSRRA